MISPKYYSYNWTPQFPRQLPEVVTTELHNNHYNKTAYLKSKTKVWQGASFGMCDENSAIMFREQGFTNMNFDVHDVSQIEIGNHKKKTRTRYFEYGE